MGKVFVVGIGPGNFENMTIRADRALCACDAIVGYPVYVDLVKDRYPGKALYQTPMTKEVARCQLALDLAREGKTVCLVCCRRQRIYGHGSCWSLSCAEKACSRKSKRSLV